MIFNKLEKLKRLRLRLVLIYNISFISIILALLENNVFFVISGFLILILSLLNYKSIKGIDEHLSAYMIFGSLPTLLIPFLSLVVWSDVDRTGLGYLLGYLVGSYTAILYMSGSLLSRVNKRIDRLKNRENK